MVAVLLVLVLAASSALAKPKICRPALRPSFALPRLHPSNQNLSHWHDAVLAVTLTSYTGWRQWEGKSLRADRHIWVTLFPDLRRFCRDARATHVTDSALVSRLERLLGLLPKQQSNESVLAQFWVEAPGLFRPCIDPETHDDTCEAHDHPHHRLRADAAHLDFLSAQLGTAYPFTALGYTADWDGEHPDECRWREGLAEFVVRPSARLTLHRVFSIAEYCG